VGLVDLRRLVLVFYCCFVGFGICGILRSVALFCDWFFCVFICVFWLMFLYFWAGGL